MRNIMKIALVVAFSILIFSLFFNRGFRFECYLGRDGVLVFDKQNGSFVFCEIYDNIVKEFNRSDMRIHVFEDGEEFGKVESCKESNMKEFDKVSVKRRND